ncbi:cob(I)alamin adenosyltransferase PduO [Gracilibacillus boraciitolerans JCM 21714]|uniref:Corrinoid adenosyltransferase n=1 Tax=Gracilibacillus boraciitolerans JCM 21714 TaxID=1298598 RepID=W4VQP5_9BACI|nr:cob(I)yrinic acid a,c-diamide adenosyltransferase [Gracilibacillus boraciitolerans]GAE95144.1 cob(I)alamin adenosyltransferase PduO [Gracilibacillus boraciitolerans JCM 21714]
MRIYTRSGDSGETSLIYGERVPKNHARVEAYGTCDEVNAVIGQAISYIEKEDFQVKAILIEELHHIQTILFHVGSEFATPNDKEVMWKLEQRHIDQLEKQIDKWQEILPELRQFILPSGHVAASTLHHARTVARRAERIAVSIQEQLGATLAVKYLNRLSDYLFVVARTVNHQLKVEEKKLKADI